MSKKKLNPSEPAEKKVGRKVIYDVRANINTERYR